MARAGRTDLPDGESEIFFSKGLDDPNQLEIIVINRSTAESLVVKIKVYSAASSDSHQSTPYPPHEPG
jgi:hypothetical protein